MKTIKAMPEHSRPREKLREKGASALTDEELVAAILGKTACPGLCGGRRVTGVPTAEPFKALSIFKRGNPK